MRKQLTTFFGILVFLPALLSQNTILRGIVKVQNSGALPLEGVQIGAFGAGAVYSNSSGMFELRFSNKQPGDRISLIVNKSGYELINEQELKNVVIRSDPDDLVIVVMSKQGERDRQALRYYNIIVTNTNNNYDQALSDIQIRLNALGEDDEERKVLYQEIETLNKEKGSERQTLQQRHLYNLQVPVSV